MVDDEDTISMDDCFTCFYDTCCNCPLNPQYRHLDSKEKLSRWKQTTNSVELIGKRKVDNPEYNLVSFHKATPLSPPMGDDGEPMTSFVEEERKKGHVFFNQIVQQTEIENCLAAKDEKQASEEGHLFDDIAAQMAAIANSDEYTSGSDPDDSYDDLSGTPSGSLSSLGSD